MVSRNRKKLAELRRVLDAAGLSGLTLLSLDDVASFEEAPETGATFEENAIAKARDAFRVTGLASVADDYDGDTRPAGRAADIGADEAGGSGPSWHLYLPLVREEAQ